eukprot:SM000065S20225  [mRNA]  locus=s65:431443:432222:+ [translate_table: standard]
MAGLLLPLLAVSALAALASSSGARFPPSRPFINVSGKTFAVSRSLFRGGAVPFVKHEDGLPFGSYLALNLNFTPALELFQRLNATQGPLLNRGEAHVTVISPVEYQVLAPLVDISDITAIALKHRIQRAAMQPICVGLASKTTVENGSSVFQDVYFVKIHTGKTIENIRYNVQQHFISRGGNGALFYYRQLLPHITIGFLHDDLFIEDGIYTGDKSCWADLHILKNKWLLPEASGWQWRARSLPGDLTEHAPSSERRLT